MSTGYEIVTTTFTVGPNDDSFFLESWGDGVVLATAQAPTGKKWVAGVENIVVGTETFQSHYQLKLPAISISSDGTEYTAILLLDKDANGDPVETTVSVDVIAIDA